MPRVTHDDPDMVFACPECDEAGGVFQRVGNGNAYVGDADAEYVCHGCQATFDTPKERESREFLPGACGPEAGTQGLGRVMAEMSVEEFDAIVQGRRSA